MLAIALTLAAAVVCQLLRFRHSAFWNRASLCAAVLAVLLAVAYATGWAYAEWLFLPFVVLAALCYTWVGGLAATLLMWALVMVVAGLPRTQGTNVLLGYLTVGCLVAALSAMSEERARRQRELDRQLYHQARQLQIQNEIVVAMQTTMDLPKLLHIILTAITAGYGLAFNRALLFLATHDEKELVGTVGIGSMSAAEGLGKWEQVIADRMTLTDFIAGRDRATLRDHDLNDVLQAVVIPLAPDDHVMYRTLQEGRPLLVRRSDAPDPYIGQLRARFGMTECAVVPMINRGKAVGVIVVDNNVNNQPIAVDDLGSLMQLATQASLAIVNAQLFEQSHRLSITDALTGLYNQRLFHERLEVEVEQASSQGTPLSLILLDVDHFKRYNDTNGHTAGNEVLSGIGALIQAHTEPGHVACRFGGEEFVLLLPGADQASALRVAEAIRMAVAVTPFVHRTGAPGERVTISAGLACHRPGVSCGQLLDEADQAMYQAKRNGRDQVQIFDREKVCT